MKHIEIDHYFVREKVALGSLITKYVPSDQQIADIFTKPLAKNQFKLLRSKLGVRSTTHISLRKDIRTTKQQPSQQPKSQ